MRILRSLAVAAALVLAGTGVPGAPASAAATTTIECRRR
jgi:hypothetical protein